MITIGVLTRHSSRYRDWVAVFGSRQVELESAETFRAALPGFSGAQAVYRLKLSALTPAQRARLEAHMATRFQLPVPEVHRDLEATGCPILAMDVILARDAASLPPPQRRRDHDRRRQRRRGRRWA